MKTLQHYQKEYTKTQIGNNQKMTQYYEKFGWEKLKNSSIKSSRIKELTCMKFNLRTKKPKIVL